MALFPQLRELFGGAKKRRTSRFDLQEHLREAARYFESIHDRIPVSKIQPPLRITSRRITTRDGFSMNVIAGVSTYSNRKGREAVDSERRGTGAQVSIPWETAEVGATNGYEPLLEPYASGDVFSFVPVKVIERVIKKHGGVEKKD